MVILGMVFHKFSIVCLPQWIEWLKCTTRSARFPQKWFRLGSWFARWGWLQHSPVIRIMQQATMFYYQSLGSISRGCTKG
jgi:hypothetical protein